MRRWVVVGLTGLAVAVGASALLPARPAAAHPLGNLTFNTYAGIVVREDEVSVDYVLDLAELPTVQTRRRIEGDGDGTLSAAENNRYRADECATLAAGLTVAVSSEPVVLGVQGSQVRFLPGQVGLQTLRLECRLTGAARFGAGGRLGFEDTNLPDRIGWREITLAGDRTTVTGTDVPATSVSSRLLAYPTDGRSPLRQLEVSAKVEPGGPAIVPGAPAPAPGASDG